MTIGAIITLLMKIFGPFLSQLLQKWLGGTLAKSAKALNLDPAANADAPPAVAASIVAKAIELTPRKQVLRRALLRHMHGMTPAAVTAGKLAAADKKEFGALAAVTE